MEARVNEMTGLTVRVEEADLLTLTGSEREAAMQGLTTGSGFPFVIVGGALACCGDYAMERIAEAVKTASLT